MKKRFLSMLLTLCVISTSCNPLDLTYGAEYTTQVDPSATQNSAASLHTMSALPYETGEFYEAMDMGFQKFPIYQSGDFCYVKLSDSQIRLVHYAGTAATVTTPKSINSIPVTSYIEIKPDSPIEDLTLSEGINLVSFEQALPHLKALHLPASFHLQDTPANIRGCINSETLQTITVDAENPSYMVRENVLYSKDGKKLYLYPAGRTDRNYTISDAVTEIASYAFAHAVHLQSMTSGAGVTRIDSYAFLDCTNLNTIQLSDSCHIFESSVFAGTKLTQFTLPAGIERMNWNALNGCDSLKEIVIPSDSPYRTVDHTIVYEGNSLCYYPSFRTQPLFTVPEFTQEIQTNSFVDNAYLEKVILPESVTKLSAQTFLHCSALKEIEAPGVQTLLAPVCLFCSDSMTFAAPSTLSAEEVSDFAGPNTTTTFLPLDVPSSPDGQPSNDDSSDAPSSNVPSFEEIPSSDEQPSGNLPSSDPGKEPTSLPSDLQPSADTSSAGSMTTEPSGLSGDIPSSKPSEPAASSGDVASSSEVSNPAASSGNLPSSSEVSEVSNPVASSGNLPSFPVASSESSSVSRPQEPSETASFPSRIESSVDSSDFRTSDIAPSKTPSANPDVSKPAMPTVEASIPSMDSKPSKVSSPSADTKPSKTSSPSADTEPSKVSSPSADTKPSKVSTPSADTKPSKTSSPSADTKPSKTSSPSADTKPSKTSSPSADTKPSKVSSPSAPSKKKPKKQTIKVSSSKITKTKGAKKFSLKAKAKTKLSYKSSKKKVATVSSKGYVTVKSTGTCIITITAKATSKYKKATKKVKLTVKKPSKKKTKKKSSSKK